MIPFEQQVQELISTPLEGCQVALDRCKDTATVTLLGPKESPYEGGLFLLRINSQPYRTQIRFLTPVFSPNIDEEGWVRFAATGSLREDLIGIQTMLKSPSLHRPVNFSASDMYLYSATAFAQAAVEATLTHAH